MVTQTKWWTNIGFFFYSVMSVCVYIAYVWFSEVWSGSSMLYAVAFTHNSPHFWLCIILIGGFTFVGDVFIEWYRFEYHPNGSDKVRQILQEKQLENGGWWINPN